MLMITDAEKEIKFQLEVIPNTHIIQSTDLGIRIGIFVVMIKQIRAT